MTGPYRFARFSDQSYELSSQGDKRFSALNARLRDGRTIEEAYQLDVKGYRVQGNDWRLGKGKPALNGKTQDDLWEDYLGLWKQWSRENPKLIIDLYEKAEGKVLTDKFASSPISQARALAEILNEWHSVTQKLMVDDSIVESPEKPKAKGFRRLRA